MGAADKAKYYQAYMFQQAQKARQQQQQVQKPQPTALVQKPQPQPQPVQVQVQPQPQPQQQQQVVPDVVVQPPPPPPPPVVVVVDPIPTTTTTTTTTRTTTTTAVTAPSTTAVFRSAGSKLLILPQVQAANPQQNNNHNNNQQIKSVASTTVSTTQASSTQTSSQSTVDSTFSGTTTTTTSTSTETPMSTDTPVVPLGNIKSVPTEVPVSSDIKIDSATASVAPGQNKQLVLILSILSGVVGLLILGGIIYYFMFMKKRNTITPQKSRHELPFQTSFHSKYYSDEKDFEKSDMFSQPTDHTFVQMPMAPLVQMPEPLVSRQNTIYSIYSSSPYLNRENTVGSTESINVNEILDVLEASLQAPSTSTDDVESNNASFQLTRSSTIHSGNGHNSRSLERFFSHVYKSQ